MAEYELPARRILSCFIPTCNNEMFLFGGYNDSDCFFVRRSKCLQRQLHHYNISRSGFVLRDNEWIPVPEWSPCRYTNHSDTHKATCAMRQLEGQSHCEVIIPTYDSFNKEPCTAILNMQTLTWTKVESDSRKALYAGDIISVANNSRILYLGGFNKQKEKLKTIYELTKDNNWKLWKHTELPYKMATTAHNLDYFPMQLNHCRSNVTL